MSIMKTALFGVAALLIAVSTASADVQVTMKDGRVSIVAKDATVRQILIEWARVGQTKIVNVERVPGGPVTQRTLTPVKRARPIDCGVGRSDSRSTSASVPPTRAAH